MASTQTARPAERHQISEGERRLLKHGRSTLISDIGGALTTKAGGVFCLCGSNGDIDLDRNGGFGLYFHDTRFLNRATLRIKGEELSLLLSDADQAESTCELTNPEIQLGQGKVLSKDVLGIRRYRALGRTVTETIKVLNFGSEAVDLPMELEFDAAFENMFAIRGADPGERGSLQQPAWDDGTIAFRYDGADGHIRTTTIAFDPRPERSLERAVVFRLQLKPGEELTVTISIKLEEKSQQGGRLEQQPPMNSRDLRWSSIESDNALFDRTIQRSFADLEMLTMRESGEVFFAAGVPWYVALFGRDSLVTALETIAYEPAIAANTLELLARYQGTKEDRWREEEPGKILHELRVGEKANLHEVPQTPYYGTVDATPLFVILLAEYVRWTGDMGLFRRLRQNMDAALEWIDRYGDSDGDGFIDYRSTSHKGMDNQGWKDSGNSVRNRDGSLAEPPIALVEVQGYVYRAKLEAAHLLRREGDHRTGAKLESDAKELRARFRDAYWMPDRNMLAQAIQKDGRQAQAITSNPGQALWGGIVDADHARAVASCLTGKSMASGWGIRTLAEGEAAYNPIDYQVGSIWPHDNAMIAAGLKRYGFNQQALAVFSGIYKAATLFPYYRLPEVFAGFSSRLYPRPVRYPVACNPQAWAAGALPYLLMTVLGLAPNALEGELEIHSPALPDWLNEVTLRGVRIGKGSVDLRYERSGDATLVAVLEKKGDVTVSIHY